MSVDDDARIYLEKASRDDFDEVLIIGLYDEDEEVWVSGNMADERVLRSILISARKLGFELELSKDKNCER